MFRKALYFLAMLKVWTIVFKKIFFMRWKARRTWGVCRGVKMLSTTNLHTEPPYPFDDSSTLIGVKSRVFVYEYIQNSRKRPLCHYCSLKKMCATIVLKLVPCRRRLIQHILSDIKAWSQHSCHLFMGVCQAIDIIRIMILMMRSWRQSRGVAPQKQQHAAAGDDRAMMLATLLPTPRSLHDLWQDHEHGVSGRKTARLFFHSERSQTSVSNIINGLKRDKKNGTLNPNLRI
jgi:hypothetical protein